MPIEYSYNLRKNNEVIPSIPAEDFYKLMHYDVARIDEYGNHYCLKDKYKDIWIPVKLI